MSASGQQPCRVQKTVHSAHSLSLTFSVPLHWGHFLKRARARVCVEAHVCVFICSCVWKPEDDLRCWWSGPVHFRKSHWLTTHSDISQQASEPYRSTRLFLPSTGTT